MNGMLIDRALMQVPTVSHPQAETLENWIF
jgi:hypothetical protein